MSEKLQKFQEDFLARVHPGTRERFNVEGMTPIIGAGRLSREEAYQVYTTDYVLRMTEVLGEQFGGCWKVLGDDDFLATCELYIKENPSTFKTLSLYGEHFPSFLQKHQGEDFDFIGELAQFEWAYQSLFHSQPDSDLLDQDSIITKTLVRKENAFWVASGSDLINIFQSKDSGIELTWETIERSGVFILYKENFQVKLAYLEPLFQELFNDLDQGHILGERLNDYEEDPRFVLLTQQQWAHFFSVIMRVYKVR